MKHI
jgi:hypothetical protein